MYLNKYTILIIVFIKCITADGDSTNVEFFIEDKQNGFKCRSSPTELYIQAKESFKIIATAKETLHTGKCVLRKDGTNSNLTTLRVKKTEPSKNVLESGELHFPSDVMNGELVLVCVVTVSRTIETNGSQCGQHPCVECGLPLNITNSVAENTARNDEQTKKENIIIIGSAVGIIVLLIILGQTIALLYFRGRARAQDRMENLRRKNPFNRNNKARYSAPPTRNTKTNREEAARDSHIYEMVVVNAMDTSSDTNSILDITERPPLPLPVEAYEEPPSKETLPRAPPKALKIPPSVPTNSVSVDSRLPTRPVKKEPPPVKPKSSKPPNVFGDENDLPGSLKRPTKPVSKAGSITRTMAANDPSLIELKHVLKMRKVEGSAPPSPMSTLERKPKPNTPKKIPPPETVPFGRNPPVGVIKPLSSADHAKPSINPVAKTNLTSTMNVKLETSNIKKPKVTQSPIQPTRLPFPNASNRHLPATNATHKTHAPPVSMSPVLHVSTESPMSPALPVSTGSLLSPAQVKAKSYRPLPPEPLEQEDVSRDVSDDEWTYEALDRYNIYNI